MRKATRTQWIKFSIVTLLYLAFLIWVKSWLGLIVLPFIFDIYISKKIPWGFWKKSENPAVRSIMSWVDAIVFALVAVYFVNIYVFQNYQVVHRMASMGIQTCAGLRQSETERYCGVQLPGRRHGSHQLPADRLLYPCLRRRKTRVSQQGEYGQPDTQAATYCLRPVLQCRT